MTQDDGRFLWLSSTFVLGKMLTITKLCAAQSEILNLALEASAFLVAKLERNCSRIKR